MAQEQDVFVLAQQALQATIKQISDEQWSLDAEAIPHWGDTKPTLRDIINRHAYDDAWVPETLAGKTLAEVGDAYEGDLLGDDPKTATQRYAADAVASVEALNDQDMSRIVHLSYGDFPVAEYLQHITTFRGFRSYTIAKFIGLDSTMPAALVDGLWEIIVPNIENWRAMGVFGEPIPTSETADWQTKLLGLVGVLQD